MNHIAPQTQRPAGKTNWSKMQGHWVLATLGKRVLRPGGMELTRWMLSKLAITSSDDVVEFAPGIGATAKEILAYHPHQYIGIDANPQAVKQLSDQLGSSSQIFMHQQASDTRLPNDSQNVVVGEAYLTMQSESEKNKIILEASRILKSQGRLGLHELGIVDVDETLSEKIKRELSQTIRVNANPLSQTEWVNLLSTHGFEILAQEIRPMDLLRAKRLIQDEGLWGSSKMIFNAMMHPGAMKRALNMRKVFEKYANHLVGISIVAKKN